MLVLSRKKDEKIVIGGDGNFPLITILVVEIRDDKVRIAVDAPRDIPVHRQEIYDAIQRENENSSTSPTTSESS